MRYKTEEQKEKHREEAKIWREKNPEKYKLSYKKNYENNSENWTNWKINNKEKVAEANKKWRLKNKEKIRESNKKYRLKNKEKYLKRCAELSKIRKEVDPVYNLKIKIRSSISDSFRRGTKKFKKLSKTEDILGCTFEFFKDYILKKCPENISLKDFNQFGYHLDHIIPISEAKTEEDIIKLNHYTNFQPLWWLDNLQKSNKII